MARKYDEVKADYHKLKELCNGNYANDFCGAWCSNDYMNMLLDNPTKPMAARLFSSLISRYYDAGYESDSGDNTGTLIDLMNPEIHEILVRNGDL
jgi:hypothetical protein